MAFVGLIAFSLPASATAIDAHYFVGNAVGCIDQDFSNTACWSHSSGGAGGAGVPTAANPVILDEAGNVGGSNIAASIAVLSVAFDIESEHELDITDGTLTFEDMTMTAGNAAPIMVILFGGSTAKLVYSGTITGDSADASLLMIFSDTVPQEIDYTGPVTESASYVTFQNIAATGGTIYCFPGCIDGGGNSNIVFGPVPGNPACAINTGIPGLTAILIVIVGVGILGMVLTPFIAYKTGKEFTYSEALILFTTVIIVTLVATVLVSNLSC